MRIAVVVTGVLVLAALVISLYGPSTRRLALALWIVAATLFGICMVLVLAFDYL